MLVAFWELVVKLEIARIRYGNQVCIDHILGLREARFLSQD